jgi:hypothetical protein
MRRRGLMRRTLALLLTNLHKRYAYVCEPDASYAIFQNFF